MPEPSSVGAVRCPNCSAVVPVAPDWRLVQCPSCGHTMARMDEDFAFD